MQTVTRSYNQFFCSGAYNLNCAEDAGGWWSSGGAWIHSLQRYEDQGQDERNDVLPVIVLGYLRFNITIYLYLDLDIYVYI